MLFGLVPVSTSELAAAVISNFLYGAPRAAQTTSIKHALEQLGVARGYRVFCTESCEQHNGREWLLDLAWWQPGQGTALACECEWGNSGEILHKFEKLLAVKAPLKLMIVASRRAGAERQDILFRTDTEAILKVLGTSLIDFSQHVAGETYILLEHVENDSHFRAYEFRVEQDGKISCDFCDAAKLFQSIEIGASAATR